MRVLVALDGEALLRDGAPTEATIQRGKVTRAADALARVAAEHEVVIAHAFDGRLGSVLGLALRNALPDRDLATVLVDVVVGADDHDLRPSRSVLEPQAIVELRSLRTLIDAGVLVTCTDGGGISVTLDGEGTMRGVDATADEDLTASLLARRLDADVLVMLSDVDAVHLDRGTGNDRSLGRVTPEELREHSFAAGSMASKVEAACRFVEATGRRAAIGELTRAVEIVRGESGTQIFPPSA